MPPAWDAMLEPRAAPGIIMTTLGRTTLRSDGNQMGTLRSWQDCLCVYLRRWKHRFPGSLSGDARLQPRPACRGPGYEPIPPRLVPGWGMAACALGRPNTRSAVRAATPQRALRSACCWLQTGLGMAVGTGISNRLTAGRCAVCLEGLCQLSHKRLSRSGISYTHQYEARATELTN